LLTDRDSIIGYDGLEGINYLKIILGALCEDVQHHIIEKGWEYILSYLGMFGDFFWSNLQETESWNMVQYKMGQNSSSSHTTL
jgi:hypothetical protein